MPVDENRPGRQHRTADARDHGRERNSVGLDDRPARRSSDPRRENDARPQHKSASDPRYIASLFEELSMANGSLVRREGLERRSRDRDGRSHGDHRHDRAGLPPRSRSLPGAPPLPAKQLTPPQAKDVKDDRTMSGSQARKGNTPVLGQNTFLAEVLKHSKQVFCSKAGDDDSGEVEDEEAGEILAEGSRKRKHVPIVWEPASKKAAAAGMEPTSASSPLSIQDRVALEALEFKQRQLELDFDPSAPAAMKASPSMSESASESKDPSIISGHQQANGNSPHQESEEGLHEDDGDTEAHASKGLASRWLTAADGDDTDEQKSSSPAKPHAAKGGPLAAVVAASQLARTGSPALDAAAGAGQAAAGQQGAGLLSSDDGSDSEPGPGSEGAASPPTQHTISRYDMRKECRNVDLFERIEKISEGTYGIVYKAREKSSGRIVALKRVKMEKERDGFPITSVREINILLNFHHPNIVNVEEIVMSHRHPDHIFMVMEYMDHDLKSLMEDKTAFSRPFSAAEAKCLMLQLLEGIAYLHANWVLHRDLKTSNILYNSKGELKLCDFGMARQFGDPLRPYTSVVCTLWYRAPELLFGTPLYSTAVDMWSVGACMGELLTGKALFPGQGDLDYIDKMVQLLGTPTETEWPGLKKLPNFKMINLKQVPSQLRARFTTASLSLGGTTLTEAGYDLLSRLLAWDPERRLSAEEALRHSTGPLELMCLVLACCLPLRWFTEPPLPQRKELMPMFAPRKAG
ncbi:hypothetical protein QJQ45_027737 [Haematococcus lacustris]|nr:hypothetical protein QJQ45_027737 [Haematococcus lacustris]